MAVFPIKECLHFFTLQDSVLHVSFERLTRQEDEFVVDFQPRDNELVNVAFR